MTDLTDHPALKAGDVVDVFVFRTKRRGYLCKGTVMWNGSTQLLPYSRTEGGFVVETSKLSQNVRFQGALIYGYRRPVQQLLCPNCELTTHARCCSWCGTAHKPSRLYHEHCSTTCEDAASLADRLSAELES